MKYRIYIALFFLLCLVPTAGLLVFGPARPAANENLPQPPSLQEPDGSFNREVLNDLSNYLDRRFALRQEMVTANHALIASLFGVSAEEDVVLGEDGWLFYADTLDDYQGVNGMTDRELWSAARTLALVQEYCRGRGVDFLFTVAPNKNSLYGERMPARYPSGAGARNIDKLIPLLEAQGVRYVDLFTPLAGEEKVLYRKGDSHWTQEGAGLAGDLLLTALGRDLTPWYGGGTAAVREEVGDLYEMLYPTGRELDEDWRYTRGFAFDYAAPIRSPEDNFIRTACPEREGSLLMFRDSFGNALHLFLAESFGRACFCRPTPYDLSYIDAEGADTVVIELVERNLDWLITRPAIFPAPERTLPGAPVPADGAASAQAEPCDNLTGFVKLSGTFEGTEADLDSPILLRLGDKVYEASPTGENSFSACVPQDSLPRSFSLLLVQDGQLVEISGIPI